MRMPFAVIAIALLSAAIAPAQQPPRPNIIFVLADDLGPGDLGCYGGTIAATPNIDRMAKQGTRFTRYYSASPICSPSRCGLITGNFPARWKITSYLQTKAGNTGCEQADFLDAAAPSLPRALRTAGYKTAHFGKWHLGGGRDVVNPPKFADYGYDEHAGTWESPEPHPDITSGNWVWSDMDKVKRWNRSAFFVDKTLDFIKRHKAGPCFVNVWLDDPHTPWVPRAEVKKGPGTLNNLQAVMVENDRQIGRLLDGLKNLGVESNTLVVFASDNGPLPTLAGQRSRELRGSKLSLYEGGIRLPCIAYWPRTVPAGTDDRTVIAAVDMFPTFVKLAGAELPKGMKPDGVDRSSAILGKPTPAREKPLFWEYGRNDKFFAYPNPKNGARSNDRSPNVAIRDRDWKFLINADGSGGELYDLATDPGESKNVADERKEIAEKLKKAALEWRKSLP